MRRRSASRGGCVRRRDDVRVGDRRPSLAVRLIRMGIQCPTRGDHPVPMKRRKHPVRHSGGRVVGQGRSLPLGGLAFLAIGQVVPITITHGRLSALRASAAIALYRHRARGMGGTDDPFYHRFGPGPNGGVDDGMAGFEG